MEKSTEVQKHITIDATAALVWNALTNNALLQEWMADEALDIKSDWKLGSNVLISGRANGSHTYKGCVLKHETEKLLRYSSWADVSNLPDEIQNYSIIEFTLSAKGNQTLLTLTHSNLIAEAAFEHSNFYWNTALHALKQLLKKKTVHGQS